MLCSPKRSDFRYLDADQFVAESHPEIRCFEILDERRDLPDRIQETLNTNPFMVFLSHRQFPQVI